MGIYRSGERGGRKMEAGKAGKRGSVRRPGR